VDGSRCLADPVPTNLLLMGWPSPEKDDRDSSFEYRPIPFVSWLVVLQE
jgi:hypothetical protein